MAADTHMPPTPEQLAGVVTNYLQLIQAEARRLNKRLAEEIVQETVVGIMRSTSFDPTQPVGGWVKWMVLGAYTNLGRRERRHIKADLPTGVTLDDLQPVGPNQDAVIQLGEIRNRLATLPDRQRQVVELMLNGHEAREMAGLLGISWEGARQLVQRTRQSLARAA